MKNLLLILMITFSASVQAQKKGIYLKKDDPLVASWVFTGAEGEGVSVLGMGMKYLFVRGGASGFNMMSTAKMDDGYMCPTYFSVAKDKTKLYVDIGKSCAVGVSDEDKKAVLAYKIKENKLILRQHGKEYTYLSAKANKNLRYKKGAYLKKNDPLINSWELANKGLGLPVLAAGGPQTYFFITGGKSARNMMSPMYEAGAGYACPGYFNITKEKNNLYIDITQCCALNATDEEKKIVVTHKIRDKGNKLILMQNGKEYVYIVSKRKYYKD